MVIDIINFIYFLGSLFAIPHATYCFYCRVSSALIATANERTESYARMVDYTSAKFFNALGFIFTEIAHPDITSSRQERIFYAFRF